MARNENGNEDFMQEAVSLVRRIEFRCPSRSNLLMIGFNAQGWLFVYLGSDPMYRFDELSRLRRAFVDGFLYRTEGNTLAKIRRHGLLESNAQHLKAESTLFRRNLSMEELQTFRSRMNLELEECLAGIKAGEITRQHPADHHQIIEQVEQGLRSVLVAKEFLAPAIVKR